MSLEIDIVTDLALIMVVAAVVTFLFHKLNQPLVLGYLIAGIVIGPYTPPGSLVSRIDILKAGAELGVVLLLFGIGLEFPLKKLRSVGKVTVGVASFEIALMFLVSYAAGFVLGWSLLDSTFLGAALASSSTAIIAKVLADLGLLKEVSATIMFGVLVVEDLIVVFLLAILQSLVSAGFLSLADIGWNLVKILAFVFGTLAIGVLVVPRLVDRVAGIGKEEVLLLVVLGLCFGFSIVGNRLGFSVAIGAFLMGVLVASAKSVERVSRLISPLKDMFGALFFVSVGALIDLGQFQALLVPALIITLVTVGGKTLGCGLGTRIFGYDTGTALKVGLGMGQIGEFAFIVMQAGLDLNAISPFLYSTVGVVVGVTAFLTPYLIKASYKIMPKHGSIP